MTRVPVAALVAAALGANAAVAAADSSRQLQVVTATSNFNDRCAVTCQAKEIAAIWLGECPDEVQGAIDRAVECTKAKCGDEAVAQFCDTVTPKSGCENLKCDGEALETTPQQPGMCEARCFANSVADLYFRGSCPEGVQAAIDEIFECNKACSDAAPADFCASLTPPVGCGGLTCGGEAVEEIELPPGVCKFRCHVDNNALDILFGECPGEVQAAINGIHDCTEACEEGAGAEFCESVKPKVGCEGLTCAGNALETTPEPPGLCKVRCLSTASWRALWGLDSCADVQTALDEAHGCLADCGEGAQEEFCSAFFGLGKCEELTCGGDPVETVEIPGACSASCALESGFDFLDNDCSVVQDAISATADCLGNCGGSAKQDFCDNVVVREGCSDLTCDGQAVEEVPEPGAVCAARCLAATDFRALWGSGECSTKQTAITDAHTCMSGCGEAEAEALCKSLRVSESCADLTCGGEPVRTSAPLTQATCLAQCLSKPLTSTGGCEALQSAIDDAVTCAEGCDFDTSQWCRTINWRGVLASKCEDLTCKGEALPDPGQPPLDTCRSCVLDSVEIEAATTCEELEASLLAVDAGCSQSACGQFGVCGKALATMVRKNLQCGPIDCLGRTIAVPGDSCAAKCGGAADLPSVTTCEALQGSIDAIKQCYEDNSEVCGRHLAGVCKAAHSIVWSVGGEVCEDLTCGDEPLEQQPECNAERAEACALDLSFNDVVRAEPNEAQCAERKAAVDAYGGCLVAAGCEPAGAAELCQTLGLAASCPDMGCAVAKVSAIQAPPASSDPDSGTPSPSTAAGNDEDKDKDKDGMVDSGAAAFAAALAPLAAACLVAQQQ